VTSQHNDSIKDGFRCLILLVHSCLIPFDLISPPGGGDCVDAWHDLAWQACKKELGTGNTHGRLA
jgi:hypothetical protein